jgi:AcrR family transcriptional regulator
MLVGMPKPASSAGSIGAPGRPAGLTRERILGTAIALADADGLGAVSIRRIAAELKARPMSLYAHIGSKDELLALMHDRVLGEALLGDVPGDWQEALRAIARRTREVTLRHPWIIADHLPRLGPSMLRHLEESAAAVAGLDADDAGKRALLIAVDTYTIGHVTLQLAGTVARSQGAGVDDAWRRSAAEYIEREVASGALPHLAEFDVQELTGDAQAEAQFEQGLNWLLAGAAAQLDAARG